MQHTHEIFDAAAKSGGEGDGEVDDEKMQHTHEIFDAATKSGGEGDREVGKIVRQNCYPYCSKLGKLFIPSIQR